MLLLRQSTAATIKCGPFVDETDGVTPETGLTISQADIRLSKNGGAFAQTNNAAGATHDEAGYYGVPLDTTDTNTLGRLKIAIAESGALPVWEDCMVIPATVFDSLVAGSDYLQADLVQWLGTAPLALSSQRVQTLVGAMGSAVLTATAIATDAITAAKIAADAIGASELAADAAAEITAAVWAAVTRTLTAGTNIALTKGTGLLGLNDLDAAGVRGAVGMAAANLDTQLAALPTAAENRAEMDANSTQLAAIVADTNELQTDDIPALIAALNNLDAAGIRAAIGMAAANLDAQIAALAAYIDTEVAAILEDTGITIPGLIATAQADLDALTGADGAVLATSQPNYAPAVAGDQMDLVNAPNATAVTALQNGLATLFKLRAYVQLLARGDAAIETDRATELGEINADEGTGAGDYSAQTDAQEAIRDRGDAAWVTGAGGSAPTVEQIRAEIDANSIMLAAIAGYLDTEMAAVLEDTGTTIPALIAALNNLSSAQAQAACAAALAAYDPPTAGELTAALAALNDLSAAEINAEVVDALATDVIADSVAAVGNRPTIAQATLMILRFLTEKSASGTTLTVNKEDGTTPVMTFTLDDADNPTSIMRAT